MGRVVRLSSFCLPCTWDLILCLLLLWAGVFDVDPSLYMYISLFWVRYLGYGNDGIYAVSRCISNLSLFPYGYMLAPTDTFKRFKPPMPNPTNQHPKTSQPKQILKSIKIIRLTKRQLIPIFKLSTSPNYRIHIHRTIPK